MLVGDSERRASTRGITAGSGKQACNLSIIEKIAVFAGEPAVHRMAGGEAAWPGAAGQGILPAGTAM